LALVANDLKKPNPNEWVTFRLVIIGIFFLIFLISRLVNNRLLTQQILVISLAGVVAAAMSWAMRLGPIRVSVVSTWPAVILAVGLRSPLFAIASFFGVFFGTKSLWGPYYQNVNTLTDIEISIAIIIAGYAFRIVLIGSVVSSEKIKEVNAKAIELQMQVESHLSRFISPVLVSEISRKRHSGISLAAAVDSVLQRTRREVAVLYSDFRSFSEKSKNFEFIEEELLPSAIGIIDEAEENLGVAKQVGDAVDSTLSLPLVGSVRALLRVIRTDTTMIDEKPYFVLGTEFINPDPLLRASLAEYLLHFGQDISVERLRKQGFELKNTSKVFDFSYVKTPEEFREVCELRLTAYQAANKVKESATADDMKDIFDDRARILIVKHSGKIVGSVRIMFHNEGSQLSYGRYFDTPPEDLPPRDQYAETSRMCTDPSFRGGDIFYQLVEHMVLTTVKSGRRYLVGGATKELVPLWEKCGFKKIGVPYSSKDLGGIQHEMIVMDSYAVALGKGVSRKLWKQSFNQLVNYIIEQELIIPTKSDRIRIGFNRALARINI
jgi:predicted GNAT family N-acyltransferase/nitrogen regulatory protein PII-like uncharacterized protein